MKYDVTALGELLIDFTHNGVSGQGNPVFEANPGGAPCNVLSMLSRFGHKTAFIGKVGNDMFGRMLARRSPNAALTQARCALMRKSPRRWPSFTSWKTATATSPSTAIPARI